VKYDRMCKNINYIRLLIHKYGDINLIEAMRKEGIK
jgi:hypothetical protein